MRRVKQTNEESKQRISMNEVPRFLPDYKTGLTKKQVEQRQEEGLTNLAVDTSFKSVKQIIFENTFTYFNLIFLILGLLLCLVQSYKNLTFLPIVIANTVIGIVQEIRSKKVLDELNVLNVTHAAVVRDGQEELVNTEDLVLDDIVIFKSGDQISADAVVVEGEVQVNESLLTGESNEIAKTSDSPLMSGSFVVSGQCHARLEKVGADSYISKLTLEAKSMGKEEQSEMVQSLNKLVKWIGILIIPIGLALFSQSFFLNGNSFAESVVSMEAALIGMIPEGLYLLTTVALALSAVRLAKQKVLLHNMKSIETLARVNVLCVDKTGTITENTMAVQKLIDVTQNQPLSPQSESAKLISDFCQNMSSDNATMNALQAYFTKGEQRKAISFTPFSSVEKFSSVTFEEGTYILGAPEMVLREDFDQFSEGIQAYAEKGYRVLVFGQYEGVLTDKVLIEKVRPISYILLSNPIRKEAYDTFRYFAEQEVEIKVISGDNPLTVSTVAQEAGVAGSENYVDAATLIDREMALEALKTKTVFGRVTPEQKKLFVELLKEAGNTVAMTGDGVNDILAMKEADCSIAMASGNEATVHASQVVLLESDFSKMPSVVLEGRQVVNNIERSSSLFLVKNIFSFLMSLFAVIFSITYPLQPSQITLISLFTIGIPSFFLALEPNKKRIEGRFLPNVLSKAFPGGFTDMLVVAALVVCGTILQLSKTDISTTATLLLIVVGFMVLYKISQPLNQFRRKLIAGCMFGMVFASLSFSGLFSLSGISPTSLLLLAMLFFTAESIFRLLTELTEKTGLFIQEKTYKTLSWEKVKAHYSRLFFDEKE